LFADNYLDLVHVDNKEMLSDLIYNKEKYKEVLFFEDK